MHRLAYIALLPLLALAQDDPDAAAAAIAKKLSVPLRLTEPALKPLLTAPDDVRLHFLARPEGVKLTDEEPCLPASTLVRQGSERRGAPAAHRLGS